MKDVFKDAKIGDRVWSTAIGWGVVDRMTNDPEYPLTVKFADGGIKLYDINGFVITGLPKPELYWDEQGETK
jgi:hypothetical protein